MIRQKHRVVVIPYGWLEMMTRYWELIAGGKSWKEIKEILENG